MAEITVVRNAAWIVGWDRGAGCHVYFSNADVAFANTTITYVGPRYEGSVSNEIDGRALMVMPGLVNVHAHPTSEPMNKGVTDEIRSPNFYHSSLYEFLPILGNDEQGIRPCHKVALAELLMSGCTSVVDYSVPFSGWLDSLAESGIRACIAPSFRDAPWYTQNGHLIEYDWSDAKRGPKGFAEAKRLVDLALQHPSGRLMGMISPGQIDTCSQSLLEDAHAYAAERNLAFQIHAAQSVNEFSEMIRRHGCTPIQWMDRIGILSERTIVGHGIFLDHHPWLHWSTRCDLDLLAERQVTVAHCPTVFMRRGISLRTFGEYLRRGINLGVGTDTYPHNMLEEMRNVATVARAVAGTVDDLDTAHIFNAATIGGAKALLRDDIGRLDVGAKADLVLVDLECPAMRPLREPIRNLIFCAAERAVAHVFVDGKQVVRDGVCTTIDLNAELEALQAAQQRALARVPELDWANRSIDELSPMVFGIHSF